MNNTAVLVTHYNRPKALARSLPQIAALGWPVLVVDDGSSLEAVEDVDTICAKHTNVVALYLPENRGLAAALNAGIAYWLADRRVEWISYFQDDVDVLPTLPAALGAAQNAELWPLVTGHDAAEHRQTGTVRIGAMTAKLKASCRATHLHAHRAYWESVLPIPTRKLGAPCREPGQVRGTGSDVDWWITQTAPMSVTRRGRFVLCLPGLVRTFLWRAEDSCWDNTQRAGEDPPLTAEG